MPRGAGCWTCWASVLRAHRHTRRVQRASGAPTTLKTRIVARNQQVVRVDRERWTQLSAAETGHVVELLEHTPSPEADAVVVADYGKGFLTQPLADPYLPGGAPAREGPGG